MLDVLARGDAHVAAAGLVEVDRHRRPLILVEGRRGADELVAGDDHLFLGGHHVDRAVALALGKDVDVEGAAAAHRLLVDQPHLEGRGAAEDVLGARRVLHPRELHDDAVLALLLDHRLGDAELVHPLVQGADVLRQRRLLDALQHLGPERGHQQQILAVVSLRERQVRNAAGDRCLRLVARLGVAEADAQDLAVARHAAVADGFLAQQGTHFRREVLGALGERGLQIDLQQEMHPAAQVEAEVHRQRVDRGQPARRSGEQVQCHRVVGICRVGVQGPVDRVARLELRVDVGEAHPHAVRVEQRAGVGQVRLLQRRLDFRHQRGIDLDRRLDARDLHRRRLAEEVRHRVEEGDRDRRRDQRIRPGGISVHLPIHDWMLFSVPLGSTVCTAAFCTLTSVLGAISMVT